MVLLGEKGALFQLPFRVLFVGGTGQLRPHSVTQAASGTVPMRST